MLFRSHREGIARNARSRCLVSICTSGSLKYTANASRRSRAYARAVINGLLGRKPCPSNNLSTQAKKRSSVGLASAKRTASLRPTRQPLIPNPRLDGVQRPDHLERLGDPRRFDIARLVKPPELTRAVNPASAKTRLNNLAVGSA